MTFTDYLTALVLYILNDIRVDIAEINQDIDDGFEDLYGRLAEEQAAERKFDEFRIHLYEDCGSAIRALTNNHSLLHDLWDHARDGFSNSPMAEELAAADDKVLGESYEKLCALVHENCRSVD